MYRLRLQVPPLREQAARGFTLVELLLVLATLVTLAALVLPRLDGVVDDARLVAVRASLRTLQATLVGDDRASGFVADVGEMPAHLSDLFRLPASLPSGNSVPSFDPRLSRGWNGPYLLDSGGRLHLDNLHGFTNEYGQEGDPAILDPWGHAIVLQTPEVPGVGLAQRQRASRLVSAGPDGIVSTPRDALFPDSVDPMAIGDDVVLYVFGRAP